MAKAPKTKKIPCAFCQGKGGQPGAERLSCIVCGGSGRVTVRQPYNICKECVGTGKKEGTNLYCLACHGKGFVEESRHPLLSKSPVSKTRRKSVKRSKNKFRKRKLTGKSVLKVRKAKAVIKKERKSPPASRLGREALRAGFFKKFLGTLKIL